MVIATMIVAIVGAVAAVIAMVYGILNKSDLTKIKEKLEIKD